jgi:hypothetical protein
MASSSTVNRIDSEETNWISAGIRDLQAAGNIRGTIQQSADDKYVLVKFDLDRGESIMLFSHEIDTIRSAGLKIHFLSRTGAYLLPADE